MRTLLGALFSFAALVIASLPFDATANLGGPSQATDSNLYASGLELTRKAPKTYLLTWDPYEVDPCENTAVYDVYRGTKEDFEPSEITLVARGLSMKSFLSHEPSERDYYYLVLVRLIPSSCALRSGAIEVFPLDLGSRYQISAGTLADTCTAQSTTEIWCSSIKETFHAVIGGQWGHEYLIGCGDGDFNGGAWNCVDLRTGYYSVVVHNTTVTILNGGWVQADTKTGKTISSIVPVFSVLARIK